MKNYKLSLVLVLGIVVAGGVFAQAKPAANAPAAESAAKNAVSLDAVPLFKGFIASDVDAKTSYFGISAFYERLLAPHYSIGGAMTLMSYSLNGTTLSSYFGLDAHGRWYPLGETLEKLFFDAGLGFNSITPKTGKAAGGFTLGLKAGYKLNIKPKFFVEPSLAYNLLKIGNMGIAPLGWQIGINLGASF
jgi:hypothetical protein